MLKLFIINSCGFPLEVKLWLGLTPNQPIYLSLPFQRVMLSEGKIGQFLSIFWLRKIKFRLKHGKCPIFEDINQMNGWLAPDLIGQFVTRNCEARPPVCLESTWLWLTIQNPSFSSTSSYWGWGGAHWKTSKKHVWLEFSFSNMYSLHFTVSFIS